MPNPAGSAVANGYYNKLLGDRITILCSHCASPFSIVLIEYEVLCPTCRTKLDVSHTVR